MCKEVRTYLYTSVIRQNIFRRRKKIKNTFLFGSFEINSKMWYTPLRNPLHCTTFFSLFLHEPNKNCDQSLSIFFGVILRRLVAKHVNVTNDSRLPICLINCTPYKIHNGSSNRFKIRGMFTMKTIKKIGFCKSTKIMFSD
jgi:hypothetical protein